MRTMLIALLLTLLTTGCGRRDVAVQPAGPEIGVTFNSKNGLLVPPATAQFIGLKTTEAAERQVNSSVTFSAQVYQAAGEFLASGTISSNEAARLKEGQSVSILCGDASIPGRISALHRGLEKANGEVEVLVSADNPGKAIVSGAFVSVSAQFGGTTVMSIPRSSVFCTTEGNFVYTVSGGHYVRASVKLGATNEDFVEVADGLYAGDQVVETPVMTLWMAELQSLRGGKACADGQ